MSISPDGLKAFKRSMTTRFNGTCEFCGDATAAGRDFAALGGHGKWFAVCATCASTVPARIAGIARRIGAIQDGLTEAQLATLSIPANLAEAIQGTLSDAETAVVAVQMAELRSTVEALVAEGKPVVRKGRPNRYGGKCANCDFYVEAGQGVYANGVCSHTVCPTFEEWVVAKYGAPVGSEALRQLAVDHAHATANCIFCSTELTHPDSDPRQGGVGYGPVCAAKYGLPHGGSTSRPARVTESGRTVHTLRDLHRAEND